METNEPGFELIKEQPYLYANDDLWDSIAMGYIKGVEQAFKDGADANQSNPLLTAVYNSNIQLATLLLEHGADANVRGSDKCSALMEAIIQNNVQMVKLLLDHGAKPYGWDKDKVTPLHRAVYKNNIEIVNLLLEYGADPNVKGYKNQTALEHARYYSRKDIEQILMEHVDKLEKYQKKENTI